MPPTPTINTPQTCPSGQSSRVRQLDELTINWHITEACNYRCQYCYAQWKDQPDSRELFHSLGNSTKLLSKLFYFFHPENDNNPLRTMLKWNKLRLNIAGGEPSILNQKLLQICKTANEIGFELSIISNGSKLSRDLIEMLAPIVNCIGISIDSQTPETNKDIGRLDQKGNLLNVAELSANLQLARKINPQISVKLNTVVNKLNSDQNMNALVSQIRPDRWKILRVLPVINEALMVSDKQFESYLSRHRAFRPIQCIEDNDAMSESYLMVDPYGRFFQNQPPSQGEGYVYSRSIISVGAEEAFSQVKLDSKRYLHRYTDDCLEEVL
ncbi:viperin family antiviral radical SAM protein [Terasakiella pusilla]|uniref:viperin family antiviral radical SAM protein n=1 Tax=Terasakiella pusilla TaxID=64973 RepID=UPI003AA7B367